VVSRNPKNHPGGIDESFFELIVYLNIAMSYIIKINDVLMTQSNKKLIKSSIPTSIIENVILKLYEKEKGCIIKLLSSFNLSLTLIFEIGKEKLV